jgi:hypothetical protein
MGGTRADNSFHARWDSLVVAWTVFWFLVPAGGKERAAADALERKRRTLNKATLKALDETPNPAKPIPQPLLNQLHQLQVDQITMEKDIERLLKEKVVREEQGYRAAATAALFQAALLLRCAELRCSELAFIDHADAQRFDDEMTFARGDLRTAGAACSGVLGKYMTPLQRRPMRRERLARRVVWLVSPRWRGSMDWDAGIGDIRQQVRALVSSIHELRDGLKVFGSDFLSAMLRRAVKDHAEDDDATLIRLLAGIVARAMDERLEPVDENYPVLIQRTRMIRSKFETLPMWSWSVRWQAYCAILMLALPFRR